MARMGRPHLCEVHERGGELLFSSNFIPPGHGVCLAVCVVGVVVSTNALVGKYVFNSSKYFAIA